MQAVDVGSVRDQVSHNMADAGKHGYPGTSWPASRQKAAAEQAANVQLLYIVTALLCLAFIGSIGPAVRPGAYGVDPGVRNWTPTGLLYALAPIPQIGFLLLAIVSALGISSANLPSSSQVTSAMSSVTSTLSHGMRGDISFRNNLPPGVMIAQDGITLLNSRGQPLACGLRLDRDGEPVTEEGYPLPDGFSVAVGGTIVDLNGRPLPRGVTIGPDGTLIAANGDVLPKSMRLGPNGTLVAVDGTLLGPDLLPVPGGFSLGEDGRMLRPNGKPVPMGVHVGCEFMLLTPEGVNLPDGIKIGPNGTILMPDGGPILGSDGHPAPPIITTTPDRAQLLACGALVVPEDYTLGPNGTLITPDGALVAPISPGRAPLALPAEDFSLGPLGNLLHHGVPVPKEAYFAVPGNLVLPGYNGGPPRVLYAHPELEEMMY